MITPSWRQIGAGLAGTRSTLVRAALVVFLALSVMIAIPAPASAEVEWSDRQISTENPASLTFGIRATAPDGIASATVSYRVLNPDGNVGGSLSVEVPSGSTVDLRAELATNDGQRYIPVGSEFVYSWELEDQSGAVTVTPEESFVFLDGRYEWQERTDGDVTVYWYGDNEANAELALQATIDAIADIETLLQVEMPYPVRVAVWRESSEGRAAQRPRGSGFEENVITGGARVSPDVLHIYDALGAFVDVARHEAAHLVTKVAGDGPFTRLPSWLDEGTAVYAQNSPGGYEVAVEFAITSDQTMRIRSMTAPTNRPELVNLFYGQSWHVVRFMIEAYGEDPFAELFAVIKEGSTTDSALTEVYGFDQDGLYNAWREHVGLEPIEFEARPQSTAIAPVEGTRPPLGIPSGGLSSGASSPSEATPAPDTDDTTTALTPDGDGGGTAMTAVIVLVITLLVAGVLGGLGFRMMRSR